MAYSPLDITLPNQTTQNVTNAFTSIRTNDEALLDQLCALGQMPGWNYDVTGGTNEYPTEIKYTKSTDANRIVRVTLTYDGSNRVSTMKVAKTTNGSTWEKVSYDGKDLCTYAYDGSGFLDSTTWSVSA